MIEDFILAVENLCCRWTERHASECTVRHMMLSGNFRAASSASALLKAK